MPLQSDLVSLYLWPYLFFPLFHFAVEAIPLSFPWCQELHFLRSLIIFCLHSSGIWFPGLLRVPIWALLSGIFRYSKLAWVESKHIWAGKLPTCESRIDLIFRLPIQISILHPRWNSTTPYGLEAGAHAELLEQSVSTCFRYSSQSCYKPYQRVLFWFSYFWL